MDEKDGKDGKDGNDWKDGKDGKDWNDGKHLLDLRRNSAKLEEVIRDYHYFKKECDLQRQIIASLRDKSCERVVDQVRYENCREENRVLRREVEEWREKYRELRDTVHHIQSLRARFHRDSHFDTVQLPVDYLCFKY